jgi:hypothetical protein
MRSFWQRRYLVGVSGQASSGQGSWSAFESGADAACTSGADVDVGYRDTVHKL